VTSAISAAFLVALVSGRWAGGALEDHGAAIGGLIVGGLIAAPFAGAITKRVPARLLTYAVGMLIVTLAVLYIILGCFLDGISMVVLTAAIVLPMIEQAGIDKIWFGIFITIVVEMAQITPPVGFNLYVLQNLTGRDIWTVTKASMPFFGLLCLGIVLITIWPDIVLVLPRQMVGR